MAAYKFILEILRIHGNICFTDTRFRRSGIHNAMFIKIVVILAIFTPSRAEVKTCGNLTIGYYCHGNHADAKISLVPNDFIAVSVQDNDLRWWYFSNGKYTPISNDVSPAKYDENVFSITIHKLNESDAGKYVLGCVYQGQSYRSRNDISLESIAGLDLGCDIESSTYSGISETTRIHVNSTGYTSSTAEVGETPSVVFTSIVITIVAICSVIVVLVFAGTVIFVVRKRGITHRALSRLASHEDSSTAHLHRDTEPSMSNCARTSNIYNEIDTDISKRDKHGFNNSKLSLLTLQQSPALPKRPSNAKPIKHDTELEYDMIKEDTKHSKVNAPIPGASKNCALDDDDYATISQRETRLEEVRDKGQILNDYIPEYSKVVKRPVYAKVQKRKENVTGTSKEAVKQQKDTTYTNEYNVKFPAIDYANIATKLGNNEIVTLDEPAKYCNLAVRRRSERMASSKSLKYAVLDHTNCEAYLKEQNCGPYDLPDFVKLVNCQYASIDFNKKAFVAPIRKAPSSWYKRNRKQQKKKV